jgi:hypothetical protein
MFLCVLIAEYSSMFYVCELKSVKLVVIYSIISVLFLHFQTKANGTNQEKNKLAMESQNNYY